VSGISLALEGFGLVIAVTLALAAALAVVGQGLVVDTLGRNGLALGISLRVALGIVIVVVIMPFGYLLQIPLRGLACGILILGALLSATWFVVRWRGTGRLEIKRLSRQEPLLAFVALIVLSPVAIFGMTYWTLDANDMPAYAAFANVWLSGSSAMDPGQFIVQHPDPYGQWAVEWADMDKLGVSGLLVFSSTVTGVMPMQLQTPVTLVILFSTLGLVFGISRGLGCSKPQGAAVAIMTSLGLLPINFLLNSQLGHIVAVLALVLSIVAVQVWAKNAHASRRCDWGWVVVAGAAVFAALMANFLVAASVLPVLITAWAIVLHGSKRPIKQRFRFAVTCLITVVVLLTPFIGRHLQAVTYLGTGEIGPKYLLASPLGMIGMQWSLDSISQNSQVLILWLLVGLLSLALMARFSLSTRLRALWGAAIIFANGATIGFYLGFDNYGFAKWTAAASMLVVPMVLSLFFQMSHQSRGATWIAIGIAGTAVVTATHTTASTPFIVPRDLFSLTHDPRINSLNEVAIDLGNYFEDGTAAAILTNPRIYVLKATHAYGAAPRAYEATLVRLDKVKPSPRMRIEPLNELYGLALANR
jgi:hypothetical protein